MKPHAITHTFTHAFIYLASQSPRRAQLLAQIGVRHELLLPDDGEDAEALESALAGDLPLAYVQRVTLLKLHAAVARARRRELPAAPILCADTTVALGRRLLGKPQGAADAAASLQALSGRTHRVLSCVALASGGQTWHATSVSHVRFAPLPPATIKAYVASGEPFGKAGAYAIQGPLAGWVQHIEGSHPGIMGLPLSETTQLLIKAGVELAL